jgi:hypothetical protein
LGFRHSKQPSKSIIPVQLDNPVGSMHISSAKLQHSATIQSSRSATIDIFANSSPWLTWPWLVGIVMFQWIKCIKITMSTYLMKPKSII